MKNGAVFKNVTQFYTVQQQLLVCVSEGVGRDVADDPCSGRGYNKYGLST